MKKLWSGLLLLLVVSVLLVGAAFATLFTPYATPLVNRVLEYSPLDIQARSVRYNYPAHFTFDHAQIHFDTQTLNVDQVQVWLSIPQLLNRQVQLDSVLLDGMDLTADQLKQFSPQWHPINMQQLAVKNLKLTGEKWQIHELSVQVRRPEWQNADQVLPFGNLQISAGVWKIGQETLSNILLDADYRPQDSTIYGGSFHWRNAMISGQAEQYGQHWSLVNATINHLNLPDQEPLPTLIDLWSPFTHYLFHINSLDLLNSSFSLQGYRFNNADISIEDIDLRHSLYQQQQASLSFNADSIENQKMQLIEPSGQLEFAEHRIHIADFDSEFAEGNLQFSATITPETLTFHQLNANDIKILDHSQQYAELVDQWLNSFDTVTFDHLDIKRGQIIQTEQEPYWQLTGINASGTDIHLINHHQIGLWDGKFELSANNLSYDQIMSSQAIIELNAEQGRWNISRLFVPLDQGYLDITAKGDLNTLSQPWQLSAEGDGVPIKPLARYFKTPVALQGLADFSTSLNGLAGDTSMLAHSLSGQMTAAIRQGKVQTLEESQKEPVFSPFSIDNLVLNADRGRIDVQSDKTNTLLQGNLDLVSPSLGTLTLSIQGQCGEFHSDLFSRTIQSTPSQTHTCIQRQENKLDSTPEPTPEKEAEPSPVMESRSHQASSEAIND